MERLLFSRVETWVFLLALLVGLLVTIGFGAVVLEADRGGRFGSAGQAAVAVAEVPRNLKKLLSQDTALTVYRPERFSKEPTGWSYPQADPQTLPDGFLLLSHYDGDLQRHVIELTELRSGAVAHRWVPEADVLLDGVARTSVFPDYPNWNTAHFREIHPLLTPDGGLIVKDHFSPLFRIDACGRRDWVIDNRTFHHSTEADPDGNLWIPGLVEPQSVKGVPPDFYEDSIIKVSPEGKILFERSVTAKLLDDGHGPTLFANGRYNEDPTHLNDVQPVPGNGPFWKAGDVFLSLRNISTVLLYRPETDEIIWSKTGPWASQHDVDVLDDYRIAVFDNDVQDRGGNAFFDEASEVQVYDFVTGEVSSPLKAPMEDSAVKTSFAGLFTALPGGFSLVEDVTEARLIVFAPDGSVAAQYVNRAANGQIYHLGWSRYLGRSTAETALRHLTKENCDG